MVSGYKMQCQNDLKNVKRLGNTSGVWHWKFQRITAIALIPLYIWFVLLLCSFITSPEQTIDLVMYRPFSLFLFSIMINLSIYHGMLGFKVVCEDYIHSELVKNGIIVLVYFTSFLTMAALTFSLLINFIVNL